MKRQRRKVSKQNAPSSQPVINRRKTPFPIRKAKQDTKEKKNKKAPLFPLAHHSQSSNVSRFLLSNSQSSNTASQGKITTPLTGTNKRKHQPNPTAIRARQPASTTPIDPENGKGDEGNVPETKARGGGGGRRREGSARSYFKTNQRERKGATNLRQKLLHAIAAATSSLPFPSLRFNSTHDTTAAAGTAIDLERMLGQESIRARTKDGAGGWGCESSRAYARTSNSRRRQEAVGVLKKEGGNATSSCFFFLRLK